MNLHSQEKDGFFSMNPFRECKMYMRDGTTLEGLARVNVNEQIVYKSNQDSKKEKFDHNDVKKVQFIGDNGNTIVKEYKIVRHLSDSYVKLLQLKEKGKINLYSFYQPGAPVNMTNTGFTSSQSSIKYYISQGNSDIVLYFGIGNVYSRKFKKKSTKFIGDCETIYSKIKNKEFKRYDIIKVVQFYNNDCNNSLE